MGKSAAAIWQTVHTERRRLAADHSDVSGEQWRLPSLCPGWDVHDVLAHLVDTARTSRLSFVRDLLAARMDFDRANEKGIAREKRHDPLIDRKTGATWGQGDNVEADSIDLLLAVSGRPVVRERLEGSGASRLARAAAGTPATHETRRP